MAVKKRRPQEATKPSYPVRDAARDLVFKITQRDIDSSKRKKKDSCAAAHALCRQDNVRQVVVHKNVTYLMHKDGTVTRYLTPKDLYMEIMIFDRGGKMEANEFRLKAPKGIMKLGAHHKPKGKSGTTGRTPISPHIIKNVRDNAPKGRNHLAALFA